MKILAIPARMESTRFPGKPLALIKGVPLIAHTIRKALLLKDECDGIVVVTDHMEIADVAEREGVSVICQPGVVARNGTERLAVAFAGYPHEAWIVNLQGDAPLTPVKTLSRLLSWPDHSVVATAIAWQERVDNDAVVTLGHRSGQAFDIARQFWRVGPTRKARESNPLHVGVYGYSVHMLHKYLAAPQAHLEIVEALEQIRWLDMGHDVAIAHEIASRRIAEVNRPEDVYVVAQLMDAEK